MPAAKRGRHSPDETFHALIGACSGASAETVPVEVDNERAAVFAAFGASTPFGHSLWNGRRFLGYFEAGSQRSQPWTPAAPVGGLRPARESRRPG